MWEKKVGYDGVGSTCSDETGECANPHEESNLYTWSAAGAGTPDAYDGTVVTIFLNQLNNRCDKNWATGCETNADCATWGGACGFAGHRDWRLPNIKELFSLHDYSGYPTVPAAFDGASCSDTCIDLADPACSCTEGSQYWSATTSTYSPYAYHAVPKEGLMSHSLKTDPRFARAVRSGP